MTQRQRIAVIALAASVLLAVVAVMLVPYVLRSELRRALPSSATDIHEQADKAFGGQIRYLKARIAEADFPAYVKALNLTPYTPDPAKPTDMQDWGRMDSDPAWWTPPLAIQGSFAREEDRKFIIAKFADGWLWAGSIE